jgi:hypothetical protein
MVCQHKTDESSEQDTKSPVLVWIISATKIGMRRLSDARERTTALSQRYADDGEQVSLYHSERSGKTTSLRRA